MVTAPTAVILGRLLQLDPAARPTAETAATELRRTATRLRGTPHSPR
jgi:hypothetical protein